MQTIGNDLQVYQRGSASIWTDTHISKGMLAAHLDPDTDAATRNPRSVTRTVDWIARESRTGSRILDLGCGPGLYATLLSRRGFVVTGIDISPRSIEYARRKAGEDGLSIDYRCRNYIEDPIEGSFDAALCIYCDFGALLPEEQAILLAKVSRILPDDGLFFFDVFSHGLCKRMAEKKDWRYEAHGGFWSGKPHFVAKETRHFPDRKVWGTRHVVIEEGNKPREYITWDHYYSEEDLRKLLGAAGFRILSIEKDLVEENAFSSHDLMFIRAGKTPVPPHPADEPD